MLDQVNTAAAHRLDTYFGPASRVSDSDILVQAGKVLADPLVAVLLEALGGYVFLLNECNQIVAANSQTYELSVPSCNSCVLGMRPGELMNCIHHSEAPNGCGTGKACRTCGAAITVLASQRKHETRTGECVITAQRGPDRVTTDFRVRATPITLAGQSFTLCSLQDISTEKRATVLQRLFLHDVSNLVTGLVGWGELIRESTHAEVAANEIVNLINRLNEQFNFQRALLEAEEGQLIVRTTTVNAAEILKDLENDFHARLGSSAFDLRFLPVDDTGPIETDPVLLRRVLTNMIQNALEASSADERVIVWYDQRNGHPTFLVHNAAVIPEAMARRLFERSYTSKREAGHGLGTYSMKLFGEQYLRGEVSFRSWQDEGTTFWISLPTESAMPPA